MRNLGIAVAFAVCAAGLLSGCDLTGSGGGNGNASAPPSTTTTTTVPASPGSPEEVPGGYASFEANVLARVVRDDPSVDQDGKPAVDCVLPASWSPGASFTCTVVDGQGNEVGTVQIAIQTPNPGQVTTWLQNWTPLTTTTS